MSKQRIGYIGVGLMGHGAAKNILQKGYPLTIMGHHKRAPVDDLVALGAREAKTAADVARASDVLFLCLPSTVEVEQAIYDASGVLEGAALGSGHTLKLINNFIAIGTSGVIAEALATATKLGVDLVKLYDVVSAGGGNSKMFQMMMPWVLDGDDSHLKGPLRIAGKDMRYYTKLAESAPAAAFIAQAVNQTYQLANIQGHGERFIPVLPGILAELNGCKIRDLDEHH